MAAPAAAAAGPAQVHHHHHHHHHGGHAHPVSAHKVTPEQIASAKKKFDINEKLEAKDMQKALAAKKSVA